jgi:hypothetical protein
MAIPIAIPIPIPIPMAIPIVIVMGASGVTTGGGFHKAGQAAQDAVAPGG